MREGWYKDDYLIVFNEAESLQASSRYGVEDAIPGFRVVGLRGWDDFIVREESGELFTVPTVPCDAKYLAPYLGRFDDVELQADPRYAGRLKWYVKPVVFGGDPNIGPNLTWITQDEHVELVRWWNEMYRSVSSSRSSG